MKKHEHTHTILYKIHTKQYRKYRNILRNKSMIIYTHTHARPEKIKEHDDFNEI